MQVSVFISMKKSVRACARKNHGECCIKMKFSIKNFTFAKEILLGSTMTAPICSVKEAFSSLRFTIVENVEKNRAPMKRSL